MKKNKTCLVWLIDDDSVSNMIHSEFFIEHFPRIQIKTFKKAEIALHDLKQIIKAKENKLIPDLILLDINMPVMNGWDFLEDFHDRTNRSCHAYFINCNRRLPKIAPIPCGNRLLNKTSRLK